MCINVQSPVSLSQAVKHNAARSFPTLSVFMGIAYVTTDLTGCCRDGKSEYFRLELPCELMGHLCVLYSQIH